MQWKSYVCVARRGWLLLLSFGFFSLRLSSCISRRLHGFACLNHLVSFSHFLCRCHCVLSLCRTIRTICGPRFRWENVPNYQNYHRAAPSARQCLASPREVAGSGREAGLVVCVNKLVACGGRWVSSGCPQGVPSLPIWVTALMGARRRDVLVFLSPGVFLVVHLSWLRIVWVYQLWWCRDRFRRLCGENVFF